MLELVPQHLIPSHWSYKYKVMTQELGRVPMDCSSKYKSIQYSDMKLGHFTAEEDALIQQRVKALENEMGRPYASIRHRRSRNLSQHTIMPQEGKAKHGHIYVYIYVGMVYVCMAYVDVVLHSANM